MAPDTLIQDERLTGDATGAELRYLSGFGNEFASEAVPGALPQGQNSPQSAAAGASMPSSCPARPSPRRGRRTAAPGSTASGPRRCTGRSAAATTG